MKKPASPQPVLYGRQWKINDNAIYKNNVYYLMLSLPTFNTTAKSLGILNVYTPFISFLLSLLCRDVKKSLVMYFAQNNQTRLQKHVVTMIQCVYTTRCDKFPFILGGPHSFHSFPVVPWPQII